MVWGYSLSFLLLVSLLASCQCSPLEDKLLQELEQRLKQRNQEALLERLVDNIEEALEERENENEANDAQDNVNAEAINGAQERTAGMDSDNYSQDMDVADPNNGEKRGNPDDLQKLGELFDFAELDEREAGAYRQEKHQVESAPIKLHKVKPIKPTKPVSVQDHCCVRGNYYIDLTTGQIRNNGQLGVSVVSRPQKQSKFKEDCCHLSAVLKINFEKITKEPCELVDGCLPGPYCGRRMLRIDLKLSPTARDDWMFNIGDSQSNNGHKGDSSHQTNDAEIDGLHPNINVQSSDLCNHNASLNRLAVYNNALASAVNYVTIYVSDKHARITNDNGLDETLCHECLYALNGQADSSFGGPNEDIYLGLNRVVGGGRYGIGVCAARLSWMCPW